MNSRPTVTVPAAVPGELLLGTYDGHHCDKLETWKEIAVYLGRDLRTVMRWEKERSLPVHRLPVAAVRRFTPTEVKSTIG